MTSVFHVMQPADIPSVKLQINFHLNFALITISEAFYPLHLANYG